MINDISLALLSVEDQNIEELSRASSYYRDNMEDFMRVLGVVADVRFDTDDMENVYHIKKEALANVCVFSGNSELMTVTKRIEVCVATRAHR